MIDFAVTFLTNLARSPDKHCLVSLLAVTQDANRKVHLKVCDIFLSFHYSNQES